MASAKLSALPALRRQQLLAEFAGLKQACPDGIFVSLTPGDSSLWSGVIFVRDVLRFQISFPDAYPRLPPLVTFATDIFHPLITPLTTYMYSTDVQDNGTVSATDEERLPPGGFSLRHGFPAWFGRRTRTAAAQLQTAQTPPRRAAASLSSGATPSSKGSAVGDSPGFAETKRNDTSTFEVLRYIRSTFDDEDVLDSLPLEAAGNPGAWHAWRTHRQDNGKVFAEASNDESNLALPLSDPPVPGAPIRKPGEWNWEGCCLGGREVQMMCLPKCSRNRAKARDNNSLIPKKKRFWHFWSRVIIVRSAVLIDHIYMATATERLHPGIIAAIAVLLTLLIALIVGVVVRGFDLGPNHSSGLRGIIFRRSRTSLTHPSLPVLPIVHETSGTVSESTTTILSPFLGQSQEVLPLPPKPAAVYRYGKS
ncbi:ubiquitin-conjugating enzyme [Seiridium cupressi]